MLLGEYNYTANFIKNDDSSWWAKAIFMIFIFDMSLVLMNLILGMAVSDIEALQRTSEVKRVTNECCIVGTIEQIATLMCKFIPYLDRYHQ